MTKSIKITCLLISTVLYLPACSTLSQSLQPQNSPSFLSKLKNDLAVCQTQPTSNICNTAIHTSLDYQANQSATDAHTKKILDIIYNGKEAQSLFLERINDINTRADFFSTNDKYYQMTNMPVRWFGASEHISRRCIFGLGAQGCGSKVTFAIAKNTTHPKLYQWRQSVGDEILQQGFPHFRELFNQSAQIKNEQRTIDWDINQLKREQAIAQELHQKYLYQPATFRHIAKTMTGIDLLNHDSRIQYGCRLMGYTKQSQCQLFSSKP